LRRRELDDVKSCGLLLFADFGDSWPDRRENPRDERFGVLRAPDADALGFALWAASKRIMPAVDPAIDSCGDDIPIAAFLILAGVLKVEGWRAEQVIGGVRHVFEHDLMT
jgi:hypothetical protein